MTSTIHHASLVHPLEPDAVTDDWASVNCHRCIAVHEGRAKPWEVRP